ncbi:hypothetical protein O181_074293 [Austropuccinia psidii MF-1]|uniref:Uncharacterized protein n=1 Tax=Austropuccinia psidii MF-1 TaxID=1389203 RepID=A0A9Q3IAU7_9BASI|nr:hypothetical protein [Austropuccinia psidii MF-1]
MSTLNSNNIKGPKKVRDSFLGPFTIIKLIGKNSVEVRLADEFSRKCTVFPASLVKPYFQTGEDKFSYRNKTSTPPDIVEIEDSHGPEKKIIKARKIILNGNVTGALLSEEGPALSKLGLLHGGLKIW